MRFSKLFTFSTKEEPKDCVLKSHSYLIRGGFIRQIGSGIYNFLPLGKMVLDKVIAIIKDEMNKSGANEVSLGFVTPADIWIKSQRYNKYGKELLTFNDRKNNNFVLGPTHEEAVVECIKGYVKSYKQLPLNLYQINLKFRDEIRPRFGLMRAREFIMKDAYSFHANSEDLDREFLLMEQTYRNIFTRLGIDFRVVDADSGQIGGSGSKEFVILAPSGEDDIAVCSGCDYASNIEIASRTPKISPEIAPQAEFAKFYTPNIVSINDVSKFFNTDSFWLLKCVAKKVVLNDTTSEVCFFFLRGSDDLSLTKALNAIPNALEIIDIDSKELENLGLIAGFIGPYGLRNITNARFIFFDNELKDANNLICGANERDYHFVGVNLGSFENIDYRDLLEVKEGDLCPKCGGILHITKGIEIGHIFKLGTRYSSVLEATFLDKDGRAQFFMMGCYGIGVSRILPAILEQKADEKGAIWGEIAPYSVVIVVSNIKNASELVYAENLYTQLLEKHIDVLLDDRDERFGSKMADFELMGFKNAIIVGKGLQENRIELVARDGLKKQVLDSTIALDDLIELL